MRRRWTRSLVLAGLGVMFWSGGVQAQSPQQGLLSEAGRARELEPMRGSVTFFYRSNELMGREGFTSFGPQFHLNGSLMGNRVFYSANLAYSRRERLVGDESTLPGGGESLIGGARVGFRVGSKSVFELEYSNDDFRSRKDSSLLFLSGQQQSSLGGIERGKSSYLALRNETQIGSIAHLSSSLAYTDHSSGLQLASSPDGPLPALFPDYLRRLEVRENARGEVWLLGLHQLETGMLFLLDQIGIRSSSGDLEGQIEDSKQLRASSVGFFLQDRWRLLRNWDMQMGVAYELPGVAEVSQRSEWSVGIHRRAQDKDTGLRFGADAFVRYGFPQLADTGRNGSSLELMNRPDDVYRNALGVNAARTSDYGGVELFLGKPLAKTFGFVLSYTFSYLWGLDQAGQDDVAFGTVEADTPSIALAKAGLDSDPTSVWKQTHLVHLTTNYKVSQTLNLGGTVNYLYADPLAFVTAETTLISPGADHNVSVDVHVEKVIEVGQTEVGLMLDVFNLLDMGSLMAFDTRYDLDLATLAGRRVQLGMRYGF